MCSLLAILRPRPPDIVPVHDGGLLFGRDGK